MRIFSYTDLIQLISALVGIGTILFLFISQPEILKRLLRSTPGQHVVVWTLAASLGVLLTISLTRILSDSPPSTSVDNPIDRRLCEANTLDLSCPRTFTHPDVISQGGKMTGIRATVIDNSKLNIPSRYTFEYTWTGSGGTWRGLQTAALFFKGEGNATVQAAVFPINRSGCFYGGGNREVKSGDLLVSPRLITGISVSLSEASGGTPC